MARKTRVLFVCIGNSCRSQIAEALARHTASDVLLAASAGLSPLGRVAEPTRAVLLEKNVPIDTQYSKSLDAVNLQDVDLIVNMTGIPGKSLFPNRRVLDWDVEDPYGESLETYRRICDDIEGRLGELVERLRGENEQGGDERGSGPAPMA